MDGPGFKEVRLAVLMAVPALLLSSISVFAEGGAENYVPSLLPQSVEQNQSVLNRRLRGAKKDLEAFRIFAESFRAGEDVAKLQQLQVAVDDFLKKHVENLLAQVNEGSSLETTRLTAEIMFIRARLFASLNRGEASRNCIAEIRRRFAPYQKIALELPGKNTTLEEALRLLDEELTKSPTTGK